MEWDTEKIFVIGKTLSVLWYGYHGHKLVALVVCFDSVIQSRPA